MEKKLLVRYSDKDLLEFKRIIDKKVLLAKEEIKDLKQQLLQIAETSDHEASYDDAGESNIKEQLSNLMARQQKFVQNLEAALVRIENKSYGICRQSGKLIRKERLLAVPHATLSIDAKNGMNKI